MFNKDFYPTPSDIAYMMLEGENVSGKIVLEPSAGKGDLVDMINQYLPDQVLACELNDDLRVIVESKCKVIGKDFLKISSQEISHIDMIVMNPPFSAEEDHIRHAWEIAPDGCKIISLCNYEMYGNQCNRKRREIKSIIEMYGYIEDLGDVFSEAERKTDASIGLIRLIKPGEQNEFEGFLMDEEPEHEQFIGLMPYNFVNDLVNRYIAAVKLFDEQLDTAVKMNNLLDSFYTSKLSMSITEQEKPVSRLEFKKDLQKNAWKFIFNKMNMEKYTTRTLRDDLNKFVEKQTNIPFTVKNIYRMLEMVVGTNSSRMDKALLDIFDRLTMHTHENRYNVEGWKTNGHYLVNKKFILSGLTDIDYGGSGTMKCNHRESGHVELINDFVKSLCFLTGENYNGVGTLWQFFHKPINEDEAFHLREYPTFYWNTWYQWGFFRFKGFKKGTMHFEFLDEDVWALFNQRIAKLKGYVLYESKPPKPERKKPAAKQTQKEFEVLATIKI